MLSAAMSSAPSLGRVIILRLCFPPSVRRILEYLPDSLDEAYEHILREIRKPNQGYAHLIVAVSGNVSGKPKPSMVAMYCSRCFAQSKLRNLQKFWHLTLMRMGSRSRKLDWRWEDQEEAIMFACSNLVIIVGPEFTYSRIVRFLHSSVKDFLTAKRLALSHTTRCRTYDHQCTSLPCIFLRFKCVRVYRDMVKDFPIVFLRGRSVLGTPMPPV